MFEKISIIEDAEVKYIEIEIVTGTMNLENLLELHSMAHILRVVNYRLQFLKSTASAVIKRVSKIVSSTHKVLLGKM